MKRTLLDLYAKAKVLFTSKNIRNAVVKIEATLLVYLLKRIRVPGVTARDTVVRQYMVVNEVAKQRTGPVYFGGDPDNKRLDSFLIKCHKESLDK